jgi:hypothetical protein
VRVLAPPRGNEVRIQIADTAKVMRVDRKKLYDFLHSNNASGRNFVEQMKRDWGVVDHKQTIAGGTQFSSGQIWVVDIPLTAGNLMSYLAAPAAKPAAAGPASPSRQLAGNQPSV